MHTKVETYASLTAPQKLTFVASNGQTYCFFVKPKDDLRVDSRLLEFDVVVNKLLSQDAEARRRNLRMLLSILIFLFYFILFYFILFFYFLVVVKVSARTPSSHSTCSAASSRSCPIW